VTVEYVVRDGKRIAVDIIDTPVRVSKARQREAEAFAKVPLREKAAVCKACKSSKVAFVWDLLRYVEWQTKGPTFSLPNGMLKRYGIDRKSKHLALARFEAEGWITVRRRPRASPIVTIIGIEAR
jgi:hypothetical protein